MIIVEGPDGAGKTTIAHEICSEFKLLERRYLGQRDKMYETTIPRTMGALARAVRCDQPAEVYDRLYFSELVYYQYTTGKCQFNSEQQDAVEKVIEALDIPVIFCIPPLEVVRMNIMEKKQMNGVQLNIDEIWNEYGLRAIGMIPRSNTMLYDYTKESSRVVFKFVKEYLQVRKEREWSPSPLQPRDESSASTTTSPQA